MREKAAAFFRKQKKEQWMLYLLLVAIGVVLLLPTGTKKTDQETEQLQKTTARQAGDAKVSLQEEMEQRLCEALSRMDGVGAVHVAVTLESTGKKIVEKDIPTRNTTEENQKGEEKGSVISSSREEATVYEKTEWGRDALCGIRRVPGRARRARDSRRRRQSGDGTGDSGGRDGIISGGRK